MEVQGIAGTGDFLHEEGLKGPYSLMVHVLGMLKVSHVNPTVRLWLLTLTKNIGSCFLWCRPVGQYCCLRLLALSHPLARENLSLECWGLLDQGPVACKAGTLSRSCVSRLVC